MTPVNGAPDAFWRDWLHAPAAGVEKSIAMESPVLTHIALIAGAAFVIREGVRSATRLAFAGVAFAWVAHWAGGFGWMRHVFF